MKLMINDENVERGKKPGKIKITKKSILFPLVNLIKINDNTFNSGCPLKVNEDHYY